MDYEDYLDGATNPEFAQMVTHVGEFTFLAQTNFLGGWSEDKERRVVFLLQRTLQEAIDTAGFHNQAMLETRKFENGLEFNYGDSDYSFSYAIDGRGRIQLSRRTSSAKNFHEWYRRFMPSLPAIVLATVEMIDDELTGFEPEEPEREYNKYKRRPRVIQVERAQYKFSVAIELSEQAKVKAKTNESSLPNIRILNESLLHRVPSRVGSLTDPLTLRPEEFSRIDYQVNRWDEPNQNLEVFKVSAPSNNMWRLLIFDFIYGGDTYIPANGERARFNQNEFLSVIRTESAYLEFFRQRCVCGFLMDVLNRGDTTSTGSRRPSGPPHPFSTNFSW